MRIKNQDLLTLGIVLFVLGLVVRVIPLPFVDAHQVIVLSIIVMTATIILIVAGIVFIVIALVKLKNEARLNERINQSAAAAVMSSQAQPEYNRRLASFCKNGAVADEQTQAKLFAQAVTTLTLEAPSSAVFADLNETTITEEKGMHVVKGWVDSQNFYGVMIRAPFTLAVFKANGVWHTSFS
ncbi:MAG: hypothetical protein AAGU77_11215 [Bacillota bacterium]